MKRSNFLKAVALAPMVLPSIAKTQRSDPDYKKFWTAEDIIPGMYVTRNSYVRGCNTVEFGESVTFQIACNLQLRAGMYLIISISDGWSYVDHNGLSKEEIAKYFNDDKYGYHKTTKQEMIEFMNIKMV